MSYSLEIEGLVAHKHKLEAEIERLRAALTDLRERAVEEGIHHFVTRIDITLKRP
jgi:hypothetical protein